MCNLLVFAGLRLLDPAPVKSPAYSPRALLPCLPLASPLLPSVISPNPLHLFPSWPSSRRARRARLVVCRRGSSPNASPPSSLYLRSTLRLLFSIKGRGRTFLVLLPARLPLMFLNEEIISMRRFLFLVHSCALLWGNFFIHIHCQPILLLLVQRRGKSWICWTHG